MIWLIEVHKVSVVKIKLNEEYGRYKIYISKINNSSKWYIMKWYKIKVKIIIDLYKSLIR